MCDYAFWGNSTRAWRKSTTLRQGRYNQALRMRAHAKYVFCWIWAFVNYYAQPIDYTDAVNAVDLSLTGVSP